MKKQFSLYDLVHIKDKLPSSMSHFTKDKDAIIVEYSHNPCQKGNDFEHSYVIYIKDEGEVAWYHDSNLTLIKKGQKQLLKEWEKRQAEQDCLNADLDWIFEHGKEVLSGASGVTIDTLAEEMGVENLWGSHGEGIVYYMNAVEVLNLAEPFLKNGNKQGFLKYCTTRD